jgi:hypothetical protein
MLFLSLSSIARVAPFAMSSCISALVLPHLEAAGNAPGEQRSARIEDWIASTLGQ